MSRTPISGDQFMKPVSRFIFIVLAFLALATTAHAQSPREQLNQMVQQLQKSPGDNALREKIIKLARTMKPSPAVPDTAVAFEGRAQFAFKSAKSEGDFLAAAQEYEKAVTAAPWVPGYYADLCTIYEKVNKFEDAKRNCEFYLIGLSDPVQMTEAKRRIGGLTYGMEQSSASAVAERERKRLDGGQWQGPEIHPLYCTREFIEIRRGEVFHGYITVNPRSDCLEASSFLGGRGHNHKTKLEGRHFFFAEGQLGVEGTITGTISDDGESISLSYTHARPGYRPIFTRVKDPRWSLGEAGPQWKQPPLPYRK